MIHDETDDSTPDDDELARVMACDELLHAAGSDQQVDWAGVAGREDRGRGRLRLLLKLLEASEPTSDDGPLEERSADGDRSAVDRPILGRFDVIEQLGSGGFGFVIRARDRLLGREVALKMPLPERVLGSGDVDRFLREARSAARLDHPNIVRVYDAGELGPLGYFIASEYCAGPSLRAWLKGQSEPIPPRLAARLVAALAGAVQHAHERGILHRDIKPDNVILAGGSDQNELVPRLTDFGLAKLVEETGDETRSDARLGTPHYMAPEQAAGRRRDVGPATDVYALGATLYEIVAGRPPFRGETDTETLRLVLEADPVAPRLLRTGLPRDLETICLKCLHKVPARRYVSAGALADDLKRFLDGRPIQGRPASRWERARGWARRRPALAASIGLAALMACGLVAGIAGWASWLERHNRQLEIEVARADRSAAEARQHARIAEERRRLADRHRHAESLRLARRALGARQIELAQDILHDIQPDVDGFDSRGFAWRYLWRQANREFSQLWGHETVALDLAFSPVGRMIATRDSRGKVLIWDLVPAMALDGARAIQSFAGGEHNRLWFSQDARIVATLNREPSRTVLNLFDSASGQHAGRLDCGESGFREICFDAASQRLAAYVIRPGEKRWILWWDLATGHRDPYSWPIPEGTTFCELIPRGRFIATTRGGRTRLLDPWTGECRAELVSPSSVRGRLFFCSVDGRVFAADREANDIALWDTSTGRELAACPMLEGATRIAVSPRGSHLAILNDRGQLTVFDPSTKRSRVLSAGSGRLFYSHSLSFSSDETLLAMGGATHPGGLRAPEIWDIATAKRLAVSPGRRFGPDVYFAPGSHSLIVMGGTRPRIWRLYPPSEPDALDGHAVEAWAAAFSHDAKIVATGSDDTNEHQTIKLWEPSTGRLIAGWKAHTATVSALAFSPDGRVLASTSLDSGKSTNPNVILWDAVSHSPLAKLEGHTDWVRSIAFSPDGRYLATASNDLTARIWDVAERKTRSVLNGHTKNLTSVVFSPDGRMLATASNDATVRLWDVTTGGSRATLPDEGNVLAIAFAPEGSLLGSVNEDGAIKLWDTASGELNRTIRGESDQLRCLAFTPDGRNVVAAGKGKVVRIWDVLTGQELLSLEGHEAQVNALAFSPDGSLLASCDHLGKVKLWRADWPGLAIGR